jgi:hypothetical protein
MKQLLEKREGLTEEELLPDVYVNSMHRLRSARKSA